MTTIQSGIDITRVEFRKGIYYLILDGKTPYERGYQHGAALEFPIKKAMRQFRQWIREIAGLEEPENVIQEFAGSTPYIQSVKDQVPDLFEEMKGIAYGSGVNFNHHCCSSKKNCINLLSAPV